jgi:uncharacterized protein
MTEQDQQKIDAARRFYQAEREVAADDIVWHVPGHNPVSGIYRGQNEYFDLMPSRMEPLDVWEFTLHDVMVNGDLVVATVHLRGERRGHTIDTMGAHLFRIAAGKVAEGWGFVAKQDVLDAFFSA